MRNMRIGAKLILLTSLLSVCVIVAMSVITIGRVGNITSRDANEIAKQAAGAYAGIVKAEVESALNEARALATFFGSAANISGLQLSRRKANMILSNFIEENAQFLGVYLAFEPDAYDGKDVNFLEDTGHDQTGRFIPHWTRDAEGNGVLEPLLDYEQEGSGDYYQLPRKRKNECVIDPYLYPVQGKEVMLSSLVVPILDKQGEFQGIAGIDLELTRINELVQEVEIGHYKGTYVHLYSANGTVAASTDESLVGKTIEEIEELEHAGEERAEEEHEGHEHAEEEHAEEEHEGHEHEEHSTYVLNGEEFVIEHESDDATGKVVSIGVPIEIGTTGTKWMVVVNIPASELALEARNLTILLAIVAVVAILIMVFAVFLISRSISIPLVKGVEFAKHIAEGDLSVRLKTSGRGDEIGQLERALNEMSGNLRDIVLQIRDGASQLATSSEEVSANSQQMATGSQNQASTLEETSASVEEMTASVEQVSDNAQAQAASVEEASSNMEQMQGSVEQVSKTLTDVSTSSQESMEKAQTGAESVTKAVEAIKSISESSEQIAGIINVISDIADQTNLLALNASIEAARAGEHGRGFAVVADEVSKLADRSSSSTKEIEKLIGESSKSVNVGVEIAQAALSSMDDIITGAQKTNEMVTALANDIEQQISAIKEVAKATESISEMSQSISAATEEQTTNAKQVSKAIENVNELTQQAASAAEEMSAATEELSTLAQTMQRLVEQFRLSNESEADRALPQPKVVKVEIEGKEHSPEPGLFVPAGNVVEQDERLQSEVTAVALKKSVNGDAA